MWKQWINAILGLLTVVIAFIGGAASASLGWTLGIIGAAVLALSLWTIGEVPKEEYERVARHRHA